MPKKTIAIFTAPQGHKSIAEAATQALTSDFNVKIFFEQDPVFSLYLPLYKYFPKGWGLPYRVSQKVFVRYQKSTRLLERLLSSKYDKMVDHFVELVNPSLVIGSHLFYNASLTRLYSQAGIPFINVVTDPRSIHRLLIAEEATVNLVFDHQANRQVKKMVPRASVLPTGWLVRSQFEQPYHQTSVRQKLGLDQKLTILMSSGSDGTSLVLKMLPALPLITTPTQIVVACGRNRRLFNLVNKLNAFLKLTPKNQVKLIPLSFTDDIHLWMKAADLVVGKAGPNSLFESVATLTPFFAITHISGQETGNLDIIRQYRLGYVEENLIYASRLLLDIIRRPGQLKRFVPYLRRVADHNRQSKVRLKALVTSLVG